MDTQEQKFAMLAERVLNGETDMDGEQLYAAQRTSDHPEIEQLVVDAYVRCCNQERAVNILCDQVDRVMQHYRSTGIRLLNDPDSAPLRAMMAQLGQAAIELEVEVKTLKGTAAAYMKHKGENK